MHLEKSLTSWTPPSISADMSPVHSGALRAAWETMRRAALIFLWRGAGFNSNILFPLSPDREERKDACVREIIADVAMIFFMAREHHLSIGNALLWPLVVVGCECGSYDIDRRNQVMDLLKVLEDHYRMEHVSTVRRLLKSLWEQRSTAILLLQTNPELEPVHVSLENVTRQARQTVALL